MRDVDPGTVGSLLGAALRVAGIGGAYGEPVAGLDIVPVRSPEVAALLAAVHGRVTGSVALVVGDRTLARPGPEPTRVRITDPAGVAELPVVLADAADTGVIVELDVDLSAPAGERSPAPAPLIDHWGEPPADLLAAVAAAERPMVLAGPGVVAAGAVPGLHALAAAGRLGVLNTWGAKGVFDWRSRHHLATAGLQALDFELGGVPESDLVIVTGIDPAEAPPERWSSVAHVMVDPAMLDPLAEHVTPLDDWRPVPELRHRLAAVTQEGWADTGSPAAPTVVTRGYGAAVGPGGRLAADAGTAGFWVARTFSTVVLGSAQVPGRAVPGFAAAVALVTRLVTPARPVLAVVDGPEPDAATRAVMDAADALGAGFGVEVWTDGGDRLDPTAHVERARRLAVVDRCEVVTLATAPWQLERIVEAAGPVVAWPDRA